MPDKDRADQSAETPDAAAALGTLAGLQPDDVAKTVTIRGEARRIQSRWPCIDRWLIADITLARSS
jgi:hypothetical protein